MKIRREVAFCSTQKRNIITPTEQSDDIRMVEIFHAGRLIQELFDLLLREAIHWRENKVILHSIYSLELIENVF